jgi:hypothetical protein
MNPVLCKHRREDDKNMDLNKTECKFAGWFCSAHGRNNSLLSVNTVLNLVCVK